MIPFRKLTEVESAEFIKYAQENDPPDLNKWELYHPICRATWVARGIVPPPTVRRAVLLGVSAQSD